MPARIGLLAFVLLIGCGGSEWVHPTKPSDAFATDYNFCETQAYNDPKLQSGMKLYIQRHIDKCLAKKGWELRETR